jgi:hypothetical protein
MWLLTGFGILAGLVVLVGFGLEAGVGLWPVLG